MSPQQPMLSVTKAIPFQSGIFADVCSAKTDLIDGTNILPFQARYIALGQSVAGTANADATFKVQYL
ncbi:hypothetical protein OkiPb00387_39280 [Escherichia coli]